MIDPLHITKFDRSIAELEDLILNAIAFAGKNAVQQSLKMHALLSDEERVSPFEKIRGWERSGTLMKKLQGSKIGKYSLLAKAYSSLALSGIDLRTCDVRELESFHGIGPKTARLFILHSRAGQEYIVLDTHVLKEMRSLGFSVPKSTPSGKTYARLEREYAQHLKSSGITDFASHDLSVWKKYARAANA